MATKRKQPDSDATPNFNHKIPASIMTPDEVSTSLGTLRFFDGLPDDATVQKVYDNLDTMRAVEVFLDFVPLASVEALHRGFQDLGVDACHKIILFSDLMDSSSLFLTGNTDTVYAIGFLNLKRDGPTVVEVPPGAGPGTVNDAFFRFVVDMGAPGPDRGKGGKYLLAFRLFHHRACLGGEAPVPAEYFVKKSPTYVNWLPLRGFMKDGGTAAAVKMVFNTIHANDVSFYREIDAVIQREPIDALPAEIRGNLAAIGMQRGKRFAPDERMQRLLVDAVAIGNATARSIAFRPRSETIWYYGRESSWFTAFDGGDYQWLVDNGNGGRNKDARTLFFYIATVNTPAMVLKMVGMGSQYALAATDSEKRYLDGSKTYKVVIPADAPVKDFWSLVVYDPQTRSMLQTSQPYPSKNSERNEDMVKGSDGSTTIWFGPKAPNGCEKNWVQTVPGKGWFLCLRLYGPLQTWFDKTWRPSEIELVA
ncbi:unnamed protein product [Prorocentrum cordatum]|uniref:DUF1254 domain-containing protein n=1 Tax=Prorocentrum cordatum TaxID=2364126 RepID=A0ABN9Y9V5_9DINO|nr:unnamed protein product [Polarella glacialis]